MKKEELKKQILQNSQKIEALVKAVKEASQQRNQNPQAWQQAADAFKKSYDILAFPGGWEQAQQLLQKEDPAIIETAIVYLEADPYFHRSGYIKEEILHILKRISLSKEQIAQLQTLILTALQTSTDRVYKAYCKLANVIQDSAFQEKIRNSMNQTQDEKIRARTEYLLNILQNKYPRTK